MAFEVAMEAQHEEPQEGQDIDSESDSSEDEEGLPRRGRGVTSEIDLILALGGPCAPVIS